MKDIKFRGLINTSYGEEEKEIDFYIYDVAVYPSGLIGFHRQQFEDVIKCKFPNISKEDWNEIMDYIDDNNVCLDGEGDYIIISCNSI